MWVFKEEEVKELNFEVPKAGDYRCRIEEVRETKTSTGKDMLALKLKLSGCNSIVFYNLVFDAMNSAIVNTKLASIFESFQIPKGNMSFTSWKGKVGAVRIKLELYNGNDQARVHYFLNQSQQKELPAWQDSQAVKSVTGNGSVPIESGSNAPFDLAENDIQF